MTDSSPTTTDILFRKFKEHRVIAWALLVAAAVVGAAASKNAVLDLLPSGAGLKLAGLLVIDDPAAIKTFRERWLASADTVTLPPALDSAEVFERLSEFQEVLTVEGIDSAGFVLFHAPPPLSVDSQATYQWLSQRARDIQRRHLQRESSPLIDIRFRNTGDSPSVLNQLELRVRRLSFRQGMLVCSPLAPTAEYNILLNAERIRDRKFLDISQVVEGKSADRFVVAVGVELGSEASYKMDLYLHYDYDRSMHLGTIRMGIRAVCAQKHLDSVRHVPLDEATGR